MFPHFTKLKYSKTKIKLKNIFILFFRGINNIKQTKIYKEIILSQDKERDINMVNHIVIGKKTSKSSFNIFLLSLNGKYKMCYTILSYNMRFIFLGH